MEYIKVSDAAKKWGVSVHRVQEYCKTGRINGAKKFGRSWMIPEEAPRPHDSRTKEAKQINQDHIRMPRRSPLLTKTNLYNAAGTAEATVEALSFNHEAQVLFRAEMAYHRGKIDKVYEDANYLLQRHSGFYAVLGAGMLLCLCAVWKGDIKLWQQAKKHISEAPASNDNEREMLDLAFASVDSEVLYYHEFPEWFERGNFEKLLPDSHPAAKVFYAKYLYVAAYGVASGQYDLQGVQGLSLMKMIPNTIETMITQAVVDKTVIPEIHLRLICAVAYHNCGMDDLAVPHIDRAIALCLPDRLYGILAQYYRMLDNRLDERISVVNKEVAKATKRLYNEYRVGMATLSGIVRNRYVASNLTIREREIAKLIVFGLSTKEIAQKLYISESTVKQAVLTVKQKTGINKRSEFAYIL